MWNMCKNKSKNLQQKIIGNIVRSCNYYNFLHFYFDLIPLIPKYGCHYFLFKYQDQMMKQPQEVSCKKRCSWNVTKFTWKKMGQRLFFNKVAGLRPSACNFIKKESLTQMSSCEYCETSKNTFLQNTSRQLLLK